jgi:hypothetical protein
LLPRTKQILNEVSGEGGEAQLSPADKARQELAKRRKQ